MTHEIVARLWVKIFPRTHFFAPPSPTPTPPPRAPRAALPNIHRAAPTHVPVHTAYYIVLSACEGCAPFWVFVVCLCVFSVCLLVVFLAAASAALALFLSFFLSSLSLSLSLALSRVGFPSYVRHSLFLWGLFFDRFFFCFCFFDLRQEKHGKDLDDAINSNRVKSNIGLVSIKKNTYINF